VHVRLLPRHGRPFRGTDHRHHATHWRASGSRAACRGCDSGGQAWIVSPSDGVHRRCRMLKAAFADAVKTGRLNLSPCRGIDLPKLTSERLNPPSPSESEGSWKRLLIHTGSRLHSRHGAVFVV